MCVRARATGALCGALHSERPWALVRLNAPTSPYHSIGCGRDAPMRRTPDGVKVNEPLETAGRGGRENNLEDCHRLINEQQHASQIM